MEEILASIRQIISEEGDEARDGAGAAQETQTQGEDGAAATAAGGATPAAAQATAASGAAREQPGRGQGSRPGGTAPSPGNTAAAPASGGDAGRPATGSPSGGSAPAGAQASSWGMQRRSDAGAAPAVTPPAAPPAAPSQPTGPTPRQSLLSSNSDAAISGAFNALAQAVLAQNARTLDSMLSDALRPLLKDWLDDNLPTLVERLVREEIERVSRGRP